MTSIDADRGSLGGAETAPDPVEIWRVENKRKPLDSNLALGTLFRGGQCVRRELNEYGGARSSPSGVLR